MNTPIEGHEARGARRGSYHMLVQRDSSKSPHDPKSFSSMNLEDRPPSRSPYSSSRTMNGVLSPNLRQELSPKAYFPISASKRIWRHIATAGFAFLLFALPMSTFLAVILITAGLPFDAKGSTACTHTENYGLDFSSAILNIDLSFGIMSFGTAKFVDLVWDIIVSRGGQALMAWISYQVYTAILLHTMERHTVSYDLYTNLTLSWASLLSLGSVARVFFTKIGVGGKLLFLWMVMGIIWVAIWPTLTNAMTGYVSQSYTLVKSKDSTGYINYTDISSTSNLAFQVWRSYSHVNATTNSTLFPIGPFLLNSGPNVTLWNSLYQDLNSQSNWPSVIIFNYTYGGEFYDVAEVSWLYDNQSYTFEYVNQPPNVRCIASSVYQWGFSSSMSFIVAVINVFWVIGTYGIWTHMNRKSELCRKRRTLGKYRAAVDMVESITRDLGPNICAYTDAELKNQLQKQPGIRYYVGCAEDGSPDHIGISSSPEKGPVSLSFGQLYGRSRGKRS